MIKKVSRDLVYDFAVRFFPDFSLNSNTFTKNLAYYYDDNIIGFLSYSVMYERAEIDYIAVDEKYRGNGVASELVKFLISNLDECNSISLEVRKNNIAAINLYLKNGFKKVCIRKRYYFDCDGILMVRD